MANARQKYDDANVLLENERWPGVQSTATMALEEVGKALLCGVAILVPAKYREELPFWTIWRSHELKLAIAHLALALLGDRPATTSVDTFIDQLTSAASADNAAKFNSFYVDYDDGVVALPSTVGESAARAMAVKVGNLLDEVEEAFSASNLFALVTATGEDRDVLVNFMRRLMIQAADEAGFLSAIFTEIDAMREGAFEWFETPLVLPPGIEEWEPPQLESRPGDSD